MLSDKNYRSYTSDLNFTRQVWHRRKNFAGETTEGEVKVILDPDSGMDATKTRSHERKLLALPGLGSRLSLHSFLGHRLGEASDAGSVSCFLTFVPSWPNDAVKEPD
jgi:hypothetical protein